MGSQNYPGKKELTLALLKICSACLMSMLQTVDNFLFSANILVFNICIMVTLCRRIFFKTSSYYDNNDSLQWVEQLHESYGAILALKLVNQLKDVFSYDGNQTEIWGIISLSQYMIRGREYTISSRLKI